MPRILSPERSRLHSMSGRIVSSRQGSALALVLSFLLVVGIVTMATSYQSNALRRQQTQSAYRYASLEIGESAVNEAASQVTIGDVFPTSTFGSDLANFFRAVSEENRSALESICDNCSEWRPLYDAQGNTAPGQEIWASWTFPSSATRIFRVPMARQVAQKVPGFKSLSDVRMLPLRFRRDFLGGDKNGRWRWQNWGVVQYDCSITMQGAYGNFTRRLIIDRLFAIRFQPDPLDPNVQIPLLRQSTHNLKTVVERP